MIKLNMLKTNFKPWINTKKLHKIIQYNQNAWLKPYVDMNKDLRKKAKNDFEKDFFLSW